MRAKSHPSEQDLIAGIRDRFRSPASRAVTLGIGDDCALLRLRPGYQAAITTDLFVEGRHFRRDTHSPESSGHRCLARGLSDLAAMGAAPVAAFLSLALPPDLVQTAAGRRWLGRFLDGLHALASRHGVPLAGGDTGQAPGGQLVADIVLVGELVASKSLTRSGAKSGDTVWVSGALGGSAAELDGMLRNPSPRRPARETNPELSPQRFPQPRLAVGRALARRSGAVGACLDVSDGLSTDLAHLAEASGVTLVVEAGLLPLHELARRRPDGLALALHGGEDYELLFTCRAGTRLPRQVDGVPLTRIGSARPRRPGEPAVVLLEPDGREVPLEPGGWEHFASPRNQPRPAKSKLKNDIIKRRGMQKEAGNDTPRTPTRAGRSRHGDPL